MLSRVGPIPLTDLFLPVGSLLFVTGLFLVLATVVNRLRRGGPWLAHPRGVGGAGAPGRIEVVQSCAVDTRRRLVLVRCGAGDALLLIGGPNDLVVLPPGPVVRALPLNPEGTP